MNKKSVASYLVLCLCVGVLYAQNTRNAEAPKPPRPQYQAYKKEKKGFLGIFKKKNDKNELKSAEEERAAFRKRTMLASKENAKTSFKIAKLKKKEAKSGESFHGHKRPPKKRPPGKQKFCKVCRIKH